MQELHFKLTIDQTNLILEALGNMPFAKVHELINSIQEQAAQQLHSDGNAQPSGKAQKGKA